MNVVNSSNSFALLPSQLHPVYISEKEHLIASMKAYYHQNCTPCYYSIDEMFQLIHEGAHLIETIKERNKHHIPCTDQEACALAWYLTAQAVLEGEGYCHGMRLIPGNEIEAFLSSHPYCHLRISTHYVESSNRFAHKGIVLRNTKLPVNTHTILFGLRFNNSHDVCTFFKLEEHGCPPFWQKKFRTVGNFLEFMGHTYDYLRTRKIVVTTKQNLKLALIKIFNLFRRILKKPAISFPTDNRTYLSEDSINPGIIHHYFQTLSHAPITAKEKKREFKLGCRDGLSKVYEILSSLKEKHSQSANYFFHYHYHRTLFESHQGRYSLHSLIERDIKRQLAHYKRKGEEVILPLIDQRLLLLRTRLN